MVISLQVQGHRQLIVRQYKLLGRGHPGSLSVGAYSNLLDNKMAIIIRGKTKCHFCGTVIEEGQKVSSFPHFVSNELDPLSVFDNGAFHLDCFQNHPLAEKAERRYEEILQRNGPGDRVCVVCNKQITNPDDYFTIGHLTDDQAAPLYVYNYTQAHSSCLSDWAELRRVYELVNDLQLSGKWRGNALEAILLELEKAAC